MAEIPKVQRQIMPDANQSLRLDPGAAARQFDIDVTRNSNAAIKGLGDLAAGVLVLAKQKEEADLTERINNYTSEMQRFQFDVDNGTIATTPGKLSDGVTTKTEEYARRLRDAYGKGLSRSQMNRFVAVTDGIALGARTNAMKHETVEMGKYRKEEDQKLIETFALQWAHDPLSTGLGSGEANFMDAIANNVAANYEGRTEEARLGIYESLSKQGAVRMVEILTEINPLVAKEALARYKDIFSETEYPAIEEAVRKAVIPAEAEVWADGFVEKFGFRGGYAESEKYIETLTPEEQEQYRRLRDEKVTAKYNEYKEIKAESLNTAYSSISSGNWNRASKDVKEAAAFLRANGDADEAFNLENILKSAFRPAGEPAISGLEMRDNFFKMVRIMRDANFASEEDAFVAFYKNPDSGYYGKFDPRMVALVKQAWTETHKKDGAKSQISSMGHLYVPFKGRLNKMIGNDVEAGLWLERKDEEYADRAPNMTAQEKYDTLMRDLTSQTVVNVQRKNLWGLLPDSVVPIKVSSFAAQEYIETLPAGSSYSPRTQAYIVPGQKEAQFFQESFLDTRDTSTRSVSIAITPPDKPKGGKAEKRTDLATIRQNMQQ